MNVLRSIKRSDRLGTALGLLLAGTTMAGAQAPTPPANFDQPLLLQEARRRFWERVAQENASLPPDSVVHSQSWEQGISWSQTGDSLTASLRHQGVAILLKGKQVGTKIQLSQIDVQEAGQTQSYRELAQVPQSVRPRILRFLEGWEKEIRGGSKGRE